MHPVGKGELYFMNALPHIFTQYVFMEIFSWFGHTHQIALTHHGMQTKESEKSKMRIFTINDHSDFK